MSGSACLVYLLRHGSTAANRELPYRLQGRGLDLPLDGVGIDQSRRVADALANLPIDAVFTSPLRRARDTAGYVGAGRALEPTLVPEIVEANVGRWEGLTWAGAKEQDPSLYEAFHNRPGTEPYPGGESYLDAQRRMIPALAALAANNAGRRIVVVSHNVTNRAYLAGLLGIPIDRARSIRQANCGISIIRYEGGGTSVETLNSTFHLAESTGGR